MEQNRASRLTSVNYANREVENNQVLISTSYSKEKGEWEKDTSQIIIKLGRALIPRVHLREGQFVLACLLKWKFKCELKNGMLSLRSSFFSLCQRAALGRGQHVIDLKLQCTFYALMVNSKQFGTVYDGSFMNNVNKQSVCIAVPLT